MASASGKKSVEAIIGGLEKGSFKPKFMDPLTRLAFAVLADQRDSADADKALSNLTAAFIDWNEIRVSRWVEIANHLSSLADADLAAIRLRNMLNRLFDLRGEMTTDFIREMKVTEAKKVLLEIDPDFNRQDIALISFQCICGVTPPLTPEMIDAAKDLGLIAKTGRKEQLVKLINEQPHEIAARIIHYLEFYQASKAKPSSRSKSTKTSAKTTAKTKKTKVSGKTTKRK